MTPSLPILDNCLFIDNSIKDIFTTCPKAGDYYLRYKRQLASERTALRFGEFIHEALAYANRNAQYPDDHIEAGQLNLLTRLFTANPCETEEWRNLDTATKLIRCYNRQYSSERHAFATNRSFEPVIEMPFAASIGVVRGLTIIYCGRIDKAVRLTDGIFVWDYKTSSMVGDAFWQDQAMSEQMRGYAWAFKECCGVEPTGYIIDCLITRASITNAMFDEKTGTCVPAKRRLSDDILEGISLVKDKSSKAKPIDFGRQRFFTKEPEGQLNEWRENFLAQVDEFLYYDSRGIFPRHHKHCIGKYGACQYYRVCELPKKSRDSALESGAFCDVTWTPLRPHGAG